MIRQKRFEDNIKTLNCHFNWKLDLTNSLPNITCDVNVLEDKFRNDIQGNPPVACKAYLLLAFTYTVGDVNKKVDYNKALEFIENSEGQAKNNAEKYLVIANKLWILKAKRDTTQSRSLLRLVEETEEKLTDNDKSDICVAEAFSLSRFTALGYTRALEKYQEAITLNPENAEAHFGVGLMLGRIRRADHGPVCTPTSEELLAFKQSIQLWPENPNPFVFYALALSDRLKDSDEVSKTIQEMDRYMKQAMSKAYDFCSGSGIVFKWCAKGYKQISRSGRMPKDKYVHYVSKRKECIDKAVELSPNDTSIQHEAGLFYWHVTSHRHIDKAESHLVKSIDCSPFRCNFWADVNLVQLRQKHRENYDILAGYSALETKYVSSPDYLSRLHQLIAEEYEDKNEYENARKEYVTSLSHDPHCKRIPKTATRLPELTKTFVDESASVYNNDIKYKLTHIENLYEAGEIYEMFKPRKLHEAQDVYERILRLDGTNTDARLSLCDILLEMELYDTCISEAMELEPVNKDEILGQAYYGKAVEYFYPIGRFQYSKSDTKEESATVEDTWTCPTDPCKPQVCDVTLPEQLDLFLLSAKHGSSQGAKTYMEALCAHMFPQNEHYRISRFIYESLAAIEYKLKDDDIAEAIKSVLGLDALSSPLNLVKTSRYRMALSQISGTVDNLSAVATIQESKNALDRTASDFVKFHFKGASASKAKQTQYYFIYLKQNKTGKLGTRSEKDFITSRRLLGERIEMNWQVHDFIDKFPDLLQFLSHRTPVFDKEYGFVAEFCEKVNVHKHEEDVTQRFELYYLAHKAAEFTEEVVQEFEKYMKP